MLAHQSHYPLSPLLSPRIQAPYRALEPLIWGTFILFQKGNEHQDWECPTMHSLQVFASVQNQGSLSAGRSAAGSQIQRKEAGLSWPLFIMWWCGQKGQCLPEEEMVILMSHKDEGNDSLSKAKCTAPLSRLKPSLNLFAFQMPLCACCRIELVKLIPS